jgi:hypothetical protein
LTDFERKYRETGRAIFYAGFRKAGRSDFSC